jgi:hypothetical protein
LNVAETGPIFILTTAVKPLSPIFSNDWQPGIAALRTSGSFKSAQTFDLSAGKVTSPVIVIAMNVPFHGLDRSASVRMNKQRFRTISQHARNIKTPPCS